MEELIDKLCAYHHPGVFNPWSEYDVSCDISPDAPAIRCQQLREYLAPRLTRAAAAEALRLLTEKKARVAQEEAFVTLRQRLGASGAARRAARSVLDVAGLLDAPPACEAP